MHPDRKNEIYKEKEKGGTVAAVAAGGDGGG